MLLLISKGINLFCLEREGKREAETVITLCSKYILLCNKYNDQSTGSSTFVLAIIYGGGNNAKLIKESLIHRIVFSH
jgi:hypothetical protein